MSRPESPGQEESQLATESNPLTPPEGVGEEAVDRLYGLPFGEFTGARDALAKQLRSEGRREQAAWVKGLRKPTVAAWAVNQLVRTQKRQAEALFSAADGLHEAQEDLARGSGDAKRLRRAGEEEQKAIAALLETATGLLRDGQELGETVLDRVRETLHAAALDEEARREVEAARLRREVSAVGFGPVSSRAPAGPREPRRGRAEGAAATGEEEREPRLAEERRAAEEELRRLRAGAREERRALSAAGKAVRQRTRERDRAQRRLEEATDEAEESQGRLVRIEQEAHEVQRRLAALRKR